MKQIDFEIKVYDNIIEIIPSEEISDNEMYEFDFKNIKATNSEIIPSLKYSLYTSLSPLYSDIDSIKSLIEDCNIEDSIILYHIREASRFASFLDTKLSEKNISFPASQFVKFRAAHDCLLKFIISKTSTAGTKGKIGETEFQDSSKFADLNKLLEYLNKQALTWQNEMTKTELKSASPKATIKSKNSTLPKTSYYRGW